MAYKVQCQQFREEEGFRNGTKAWDKKIEEIDALQEEYGFEQGVKELFYGLASHGIVETIVKERVITVNQILDEKGYE